MNFDVFEKNLIVKGLDCLKNNLEKNRLVFDIGSVQREQAENKISIIFDIKNKLDGSADFTSAEKMVALEGLDLAKENLINTRAVFDVGTLQRENLENNLLRIARIRDSFDKSNSLDGLIDTVKQNKQSQFNEKSTFRSNDGFTL